jgi:hypothetical protein
MGRPTDLLILCTIILTASLRNPSEIPQYS